ncbi:hypothetical protein FK535_26660 [Mycolicibacterium sp. 018/SC-01/001]|uniref:hypothetical protein n=1 Tax=Mycolicibacterium sp. 018/SC-01/001 TaxID=2592069 RepID=UPI00117EEA50|nr:hypothetical protein [Mycolicibacterium sp. 018/SC-01/001]TRW77586.1 hypothetical protein FK535_26660 [Mycolicibacterium sp. 018/SC-01/001]
MPKVIRPWLTVALTVLGAGVVTVSAPVVGDSEDGVRVQNSAIVQNAAPSPLQYYPQVAARSFANARRLVDEYLQEPLPVLRAVADSQHQAVVQILRSAAELDPDAFAHAVLAAAEQPVSSLTRVVGSGEPFRTASSLLVRVTVPAASGVLAGGTAAGEIADAAADLDPVRVVSGMVNLPARTADGLLNGRVDGQHDEYFGLLGSVVQAPVSEDISGPVDYLIHSLRDIGQTIATPAPQSDPVAEPAGTRDLDSTPASSPVSASDDAAAADHADHAGERPAEDAPSSRRGVTPHRASPARSLRHQQKASTPSASE